jgi:putative restriction endonuclease
MRKFPKRMNRGKDPIPFGIPFGFNTKAAMREFIEKLVNTNPYYLRKPEEEILDAEGSGEFSELTKTEVTSIVSSRRGQGQFRKDLIKLWKRCSVTGCDQIEVLKASHIKPWRDGNNFERLDYYNGLLLTPNLDALFDSGMITFDPSGKVVISKVLDTKTRNILGIDTSAKLSMVHKNSEKYFKYHRTFIFQGE